MATSTSPLPTTNSSSNCISSTATTNTTCPFLHSASKISSPRNRNRGMTSHKISCTHGDQNHGSSSKYDGQPSIEKLDRRKMLIGLGGLYGVAGLGDNDDDANNKKKKKSDIANASDEQPPKEKTALGEFPVVLNKVIRTVVPRPKISRNKKEKEDEEEILVIDGIELEKDTFVKFDVFINDEDDPVSRPDSTEFAGSFVNVPHKHTHGKKTKTTLRLGLTDLLEDLNVEGDETLVVTLVPRTGANNVTIGGIKIEFDA